MTFTSAWNESMKKRLAAAFAVMLAAGMGASALAPSVAFAEPASGDTTSGGTTSGDTTTTTPGTGTGDADADATADADKTAAENVDKLIKEIGTVKGDTETGDRIAAARAAYDALTDDQKKLVKGLDVLKAAEEVHPKAVEKRKTAEKRAQIQRMYNPYSGEHFYTGDAKEVEELKKAGWNDEGIGWFSLEKATNADAVPVFRLYNKWTGEHHYTIDEAERDACVKAGWNDEDIEFYAAKEEATNLGAVYRQYNPFAKAFTHNWTMDADEVKGLIEKGWKDEEVAWYAENPIPTENPGNIIYRMYNRWTGEHIFTIDIEEVKATKAAGWTYEYIAWPGAPKDDANASKVFRVYNPYAGDHLYTLDEDEAKGLVEKGWRDEGVQFYAYSPEKAKELNDPEKYKAVYRSYNPYAKVGSHHFTIDKKEHDALVEIGWKDEQAAWYYAEADQAKA